MNISEDQSYEEIYICFCFVLFFRSSIRLMKSDKWKLSLSGQGHIILVVDGSMWKIILNVQETEYAANEENSPDSGTSPYTPGVWWITNLKVS